MFVYPHFFSVFFFFFCSLLLNSIQKNLLPHYMLYVLGQNDERAYGYGYDCGGATQNDRLEPIAMMVINIYKFRTKPFVIVEWICICGKQY